MSSPKHYELCKQVARCKRKHKRHLAKAHRARLRALSFMNEDNNNIKRFAHELFK